MVVPGVNVTARGFDRIAFCTFGGNDEADLYERAGDNHWEAAAPRFLELHGDVPRSRKPWPR